jgi:hypothetical protein
MPREEEKKHSGRNRVSKSKEVLEGLFGSVNDKDS